jgi:hypothetical protein
MVDRRNRILSENSAERGTMLRKGVIILNTFEALITEMFCSQEFPNIADDVVMII